MHRLQLLPLLTRHSITRLSQPNTPPICLRFHTATMSWMDTWSRPSKSQAIPAPYYLLPGGEDTAYCHSCGRVVSSRRTTAAGGGKAPTKYCSTRCRSHRPGKLDRQLEEAFVLFLSGEEGFEDGRKGRDKHVKGESRILVPCSVVERHVFGEEEAVAEDAGEAGEQGAKEGTEQESEKKATKPKSDSESDFEPTTAPQVNEVFERFNDEGVAGIAVHDPAEQPRQPPRHQVKSGKGKKSKAKKEALQKAEAKKGDELDELDEKQKQGQRRARHKEMAKCAARRGVVFGFVVEGTDERRLCEAIVGGKVVEPSYAKGDWAIRWRE